MLNPGTLAPEVRQAAIANLKEIAAYGRKGTFLSPDVGAYGPVTLGWPSCSRTPETFSSTGRRLEALISS